MLRKTSLVLAIAAALMLPSATFGKGGGPRGGYHGHYYGHGVWGHCWPGGGWRYGGWSGYGCWQWTPDGSICWICGWEARWKFLRRTRRFSQINAKWA